MKQQQLEAELLNMALRRGLAKEQKVARSIRAVMDKRPFMPRSVLYDMRRASCSQAEDTRPQISQCSQFCNPTTLHIDLNSVRREIKATLQRMHAQALAVLNATAADDSLSFKFNIQVNTAAGPTTEVTSTTPVNCALDHAVRLLGPKMHVWNPVEITGPRCYRGLDVVVAMRVSSNSQLSLVLRTKLSYSTVLAPHAIATTAIGDYFCGLLSPSTGAEPYVSASAHGLLFSGHLQIQRVSL